MRKLYAVIERIKDTEVPILITGESGTGKEVVAKAVHASGVPAREAASSSASTAAPYRGTSSRARALRPREGGRSRGRTAIARGLFQGGGGRTILLDEIGEMPLKMQTSLLRTLQESSVRPVGGAKEEKVERADHRRDQPRAGER